MIDMDIDDECDPLLCCKRDKNKTKDKRNISSIFLNDVHATSLALSRLRHKRPMRVINIKITFVLLRTNSFDTIDNCFGSCYLTFNDIFLCLTNLIVDCVND